MVYFSTCRLGSFNALTSTGTFWPCRAVDGRESDWANWLGSVGTVGTGGAPALLKSGRLVKRVEYRLLTRSEVLAVVVSPFTFGRMAFEFWVCWNGPDIGFGPLMGGPRRDFFWRKEKPLPLSSMFCKPWLVYASHGMHGVKGASREACLEDRRIRALNSVAWRFPGELQNFVGFRHAKAGSPYQYQSVSLHRRRAGSISRILSFCVSFYIL